VDTITWNENQLLDLLVAEQELGGGEAGEHAPHV
jgi:hypothetical protein